jgi:hypothetical protein
MVASDFSTGLWIAPGRAAEGGFVLVVINIGVGPGAPLYLRTLFKPTRRAK